ncbi:MAG: DUF5665 domain-containing protein [Patescibacteria group bacterium]
MKTGANNFKEKKSQVFLRGIISGIGWSLGTIIGFAIIIVLATYIFNALGKLPLIGDFLANIVEVTNKAIETKGGL